MTKMVIVDAMISEREAIVPREGGKKTVERGPGMEAASCQGMAVVLLANMVLLAIQRAITVETGDLIDMAVASEIRTEMADQTIREEAETIATAVETEGAATILEEAQTTEEAASTGIAVETVLAVTDAILLGHP